jgi:hypothetical protein
MSEMTDNNDLVAQIKRMHADEMKMIEMSLHHWEARREALKNVIERTELIEDYTTREAARLRALAPGNP